MNNSFDPIIGFFVALSTLFFGYIFEYFMKMRNIEKHEEVNINYNNYMQQPQAQLYIPVGNGIWINNIDKQSILEIINSATNSLNYVNESGFLIVNEEEHLEDPSKSITLTQLFSYINTLNVKIILAFEDTYSNIISGKDANMVNVQNSKTLLLDRKNTDVIGDLASKAITLKYEIDGPVENDGVELTPLYIENKIRDELKLPLKKIDENIINTSNTFDFKYQSPTNAQNVITDKSLGFSENLYNNNQYSEDNNNELTENVYSQVSEIFKVEENAYDVDQSNEYNDEYFSSLESYNNTEFKEDTTSTWDRAHQFEQDFNYSQSLTGSSKSSEEIEQVSKDINNSEDIDYSKFDELNETASLDELTEIAELDDIENEDPLVGYNNFNKESDGNQREDSFDYDFDDEDFDDDFDDEELNRLYEEIKNNNMFDDNEDDEETYDDEMYNEILNEYNENMSQDGILAVSDNTESNYSMNNSLGSSEESIVILASTAKGSGGVYNRKEGEGGSLKLLESEIGEMTFENIAVNPGVYSMTLNYSAMMWSNIDVIVNGNKQFQLEVYGEGNIDKIIRTSINIPLDNGLNSIQFKNSSYQNILIEKLEFNWVDSLENASSYVVA